MEVQNPRSEITPASLSNPTLSKKDLSNLINEWLTRFALNASVALDSRTRALYLRTWEDGFEDVEPDRLKAAFIACLRSHPFKTMPTIGDVRKHLHKAEENEAMLKAERKWQWVLDFIRRFYSPDMPGGVSSGAPAMREQTLTAIRAAGGMAWIAECDREALIWCKKAFIESYLAWDEMEKGTYLLPDGPIKDAFAAAAAAKILPEGNFQLAKSASPNRPEVIESAKDPSASEKNVVEPKK